MDDAIRQLVCDQGGNRAESSLPDQSSLLCLAMLHATMALAHSRSQQVQNPVCDRVITHKQEGTSACESRDTRISRGVGIYRGDSFCAWEPGRAWASRRVPCQALYRGHSRYGRNRPVMLPALVEC
jgi:hypothetical protein